MTATQIIVFEEIDSTNLEARRRADAGETGPLWLTAATQSAGRGRRGRVWETTTGNLAATYLFTTTKPAAEAAQVSFVAALAVWDLANLSLPPRGGGSTGEAGVGGPSALEKEPPTSRARGRDPLPPQAGAENGFITVKWPNDLLINGRKASGILVESGQGSGGLWLAVGIGVNLTIAPEPAPDAAIVPTSFRAEGLEPPLPLEALAVLDRALTRWLEIWSHEGFRAIAEAWSARAHGLGQTCTARLPAETVVGVAEGLDGDGALRLRLDDGTVRRITAGDVFFSGAA